MHRSRTPPPARSVAEALDRQFRVPELKKLAGLFSDSVPTRKAELVDALAERMTGDALRETWAMLDQRAQEAVGEAVHGGTDGEYDAARMRAKYGDEPEWGSLNPRSKDRPSPLWLFFCAERRVPAELAAELATFLPAPRAPVVRTVGAPPAEVPVEAFVFDEAKHEYVSGTEDVPLTVRDTEATAQFEVLAVLGLAAREKLAVSEKRREPTAATVRTVSEALRNGDFYPSDLAAPRGRGRSAYDSADEPGPIRAFAWPMLLQVGGLARPSGTRLRLTKAGERALAGDPAVALRTLWRKWSESASFDELSRVEIIKGQRRRGRGGLTAVAPRRHAIADALADCPVSEWVAVNELFRYMRAAGHDFEVTRNPWDLYIEDREYGSLGYQGFGGWPILQARYALALLFEYVATLGMIDVAYIPPAGARKDYTHIWGADDASFFSRYDGLLYLRLTPLGAYCLGLSEQYEAADAREDAGLMVLPNLEITVMGAALGPADELLLDRYAARRSERVWALERPRLLAAAEAGHPVSALRTFLLARVDEPLPEAVRRFLDDAADRTTRLRDRGDARLIECVDADLARRLAAEPSLRDRCMRAGERHLVVPGQEEAAFRRALRRLGYVAAPG